MAACSVVGVVCVLWFRVRVPLVRYLKGTPASPHRCVCLVSTLQVHLPQSIQHNTIQLIVISPTCWPITPARLTGARTCSGADMPDMSHPWVVVRLVKLVILIPYNCKCLFVYKRINKYIYSNIYIYIFLGERFWCGVVWCSVLGVRCSVVWSWVCVM